MYLLGPNLLSAAGHRENFPLVISTFYVVVYRIPPNFVESYNFGTNVPFLEEEDSSTESNLLLIEFSLCWMIRYSR